MAKCISRQDLVLGRKDRQLSLPREADKPGNRLDARVHTYCFKLIGAVLDHARRIGRARKPRRHGIDDMAHVPADIVDGQLRENLLLGHAFLIP